MQLARGGSISALLVMDNCIQYIYAGKQTYYFKQDKNIVYVKDNYPSSMSFMCLTACFRARWVMLWGGQFYRNSIWAIEFMKTSSDNTFIPQRMLVEPLEQNMY